MGLRWSFTTSEFLKGICACDPLKREGRELVFVVSAHFTVSPFFLEAKKLNTSTFNYNVSYFITLLIYIYQ